VVGDLPTKDSNYRGVSIPKQLYLAIQGFIEENGEYNSVSDFISESARLRMEQARTATSAKVIKCE
jgi:Arc/MetJ-type ribon-helix-helix transcriptional regulator